MGAPERLRSQRTACQTAMLDGEHQVRPQASSVSRDRFVNHVPGSDNTFGLCYGTTGDSPSCRLPARLVTE